MSHPFGVVTLWEFGDPELARRGPCTARQQLPAQRARVVCQVEDGRTRRSVLAAGAMGPDVAGGGARRTVLDV
jgi:hypothetical protein